MRDDDLDGGHVVGARKRLVEDADSTDDLANLFDEVLIASLVHVRWIANDKLALSDLLTRLNTAHATLVVVEDLIDVLVEHEGTSLDRTHSREAFWDTTETIDGVDERRVTVTADRIHVKLDFIDGFNGGTVEETIIGEQRDSVTNEIDGVGFEFELVQEFSHGHAGEIVLLMSRDILGLVVRNVDEEILASALLEKTHEI